MLSVTCLVVQDLLEPDLLALSVELIEFFRSLVAQQRHRQVYRRGLGGRSPLHLRL
jgi:hypothetical protein